jgi:hypothetical protein
MERDQSDGDTDRKEINETEEEIPESEGYVLGGLFSCCAQQIGMHRMDGSNCLIPIIPMDNK